MSITFLSCFSVGGFEETIETTIPSFLKYLRIHASTSAFVIGLINLSNLSWYEGAPRFPNNSFLSLYFATTS